MNTHKVTTVVQTYCRFSSMDDLNYLGAAVFWLYIVAALVFTGVAVYTIADLRRDNSHGRNATWTRSTTLFTGLACLSFTVLSFNMLHVLVHSFRAWLGRHPTALQEGYPTAVWHWSITSTLFQNFAEAIVADSARSLWTQCELWTTLSICLYMGRTGWCYPQAERRYRLN